MTAGARQRQSLQGAAWAAIRRCVFWGTFPPSRGSLGSPHPGCAGARWLSPGGVAGSQQLPDGGSRRTTRGHTSFTAHAALLTPSSAAPAPRGNPPGRAPRHSTALQQTTSPPGCRGQVTCPGPPSEDPRQRCTAHTGERASWKQRPCFPCAKARHSQSSTSSFRSPRGTIRRGDPRVQLGLCAR